MNHYLTFGIFCFTTFLTIINPLSLMPVYLTMTSELSAEDKRITALKAVITAFITMVTFALAGQAIFDFFQITTNGLRVVGGILFLLIGMDMLQARLPRIRIKKKDVKEYVSDISVTPLGIPMICGPGAITNSIILMGDAKSHAMKAMLFASMLAVSLLTLVVLLFSPRIVKFIGDTGNKVMMRLMGLIVMVVAVELFFAGLKPIIRDILNIPS
jgi:multiple antibiotic resistance protein